MDEAKWLSSRDPRLLYAHARKVAKPTLKSGRRRLRLYACACCRQVWHLLDRNATRAAVEVSEAYADGRAAIHMLDEASRKAWALLRTNRVAREPALRAAAYAAVYAAGAAITRQAGMAASEARRALRSAADDPDEAFAAAGLLQCELLRDVFGNPFRPVSAGPTWLRWDGGAVVKIARATYDERDFARLPVLADALEEAGCTEEALLMHLRGPGPHARGCWVLDLLRGP